MPRAPPVRALHEREVLGRPLLERLVLSRVVRDPDGRTRLRRGLRLDGHTGAAVLLALERHVLLGPELLDERDPFDEPRDAVLAGQDRKSTRLYSSHITISY